MKKTVTFIFFLAFLMSCSDPGEMAADGGPMARELSQVTAWPHQMSGILEIIEAGDYGDTDYPEWAVGSLVSAEDEYGVPIDIGAGVVARAGIDIDSGKVVTVWLGAPKKEYGEWVYPVEKITGH